MNEKKIEPIKEYTREESKSTYEGIYSDVDRFIEMKLGWRGTHTLITTILEKELENADVIDIGCGLGRLSLLASKKAKSVTGVDMMKQPIEVANILKQATGCQNIEFIVSPVEELETRRQYDIVFLIGTLEHLIDVTALFNAINTLIKPGGYFVIACPAESNYRGDISSLLWNLFNFPMSLSDVRIVTSSYIHELAETYAYDVVNITGTLYNRAWTSVANTDLKKRIRNVLRDVKDKTALLDINLDAFDSWIEERTLENRMLIQDWTVKGILKPMPTREKFEVDERVIKINNLSLDVIQEFLSNDFRAEPYYSDASPYNIMGGQVIYILKKK